ncbi:MAG: NAD(P)(+) transhydrogenase (Re/Si-specific) subunit beta [Chloroflexi bacterium]|nr:NAD(P)(+) transhydrogenase (Re/Si-specific) subunit beta [Chloroflexota bacterium]MYF79265.1 NAD(P)(+) transhydrogenase (Re/Si-specific) subunit beta [Chloroflexota bacterium]MYK61836.1 NAD(P)(+) transhydrogenase (Re/Si-specific) subunit beta [Chloroflexota bacterium]
MDESTQILDNVTLAAYIVASVLFIIGLLWLRSPETARAGNRLSALGMLIAIVFTVIDRDIVSYEWIIVGFIVGALLGAIAARQVQLTAMPQMVAIFNGFGGAASAVVAAAQILSQNDTRDVDTVVSVTVALSVLIGSLTLTGSLIAFGKLQGIVATQPVLIPLRHVVNVVLAIAGIAMAGLLIYDANLEWALVAMAVVALIIGVLIVIPIGGADMPVVIALLNSYSGLAAAATGFVIDNPMLIIAGSLVGASGLILTRIMTRAMNRSLGNVMFGGFGVADSTGGTAPGATDTDRPVRSVNAAEAAILLGYADSVIFVPGYGLAVAQAQHQVRDLADMLKERGTQVRYAIHPVAGRMPGHMNVLLAEADVPYDELKDLDEINDDFRRADVAVVVGANDVTNPAARTDRSSPIYGMPILNVDQARSAIVLKRSMASGFAGVENELFHMENTMMLFGDARASVEDLLTEMKEL